MGVEIKERRGQRGAKNTTSLSTRHPRRPSSPLTLNSLHAPLRRGDLPNAAAGPNQGAAGFEEEEEEAEEGGWVGGGRWAGSPCPGLDRLPRGLQTCFKGKSGDVTFFCAVQIR